MTQASLTTGAASAAEAAQEGKKQQQQARVVALAGESTPKQVHFSPRNEEFPCGTSPLSSPTRARSRPRARGILKHGSENMRRQRASSDADELGENGLLDRLTPPPNTTDSPQAMSEEIAAAVEHLQQAAPGNSTEAETLAAYNQLNKLIAWHGGGLGEDNTQVAIVVECVRRDIDDRDTGRQVVLIATQCLGGALYSGAVGSTKSEHVARALEAVTRRVLQEFVTDRHVVKAALRAVGAIRLMTAADAQAQAPQMVRLCVSTLTQFAGLATMQFEGLATLEGLLRRAPGATRQAYREWMFLVLRFIVSAVPGVQTKADGILRHNMPWVAADVHEPEMDTAVQGFLTTRLNHVMAGAMRMVNHDDHILAARVWGMVVTICARHCRPHLSSILRLAQECFNSTEESVLVVMLTQWRCLIYAFALDNRIHHHKCVELVMSPIVTLLTAPDTSVAVLEACIRCWATLVYALGSEIGSHIDIISRISTLVDGRPHSVHIAVARVLEALFNCFVLSKDRVAQFVIPRMIIGTTTLAAADGRSLSSTNGPFSSVTAHVGDHTSILCAYIIGLGATSPIVPVVAEIVVQFVKRYVSAFQRCGLGGSCESRDSLQHGVFATLCDALTKVMAAPACESDSNCTRLVIALADACLGAQYSEKDANDGICATCLGRYAKTPCALLFAALHSRLARQLEKVHVEIPRLASDFLQTTGITLSAEATGQQIPMDQIKTPYLFMLARRHIDGLLLQLRASCSDIQNADREFIISSISQHLPLLLPDTPPSGEFLDAQLDNVIATVSLLARFLIDSPSKDTIEITNDYRIHSEMELLLTRILDCVPAQLATNFDAAGACMLMWNVLRMHHKLPSKSQGSQYQIIRRVGETLRGEYFWRSMVEVVVGLELVGQLVVDIEGLRLLREVFISGVVTTANSAEAMGCSALAMVLLTAALRNATECRWKPTLTLIEHIREVVRASDLKTVEELNAVIGYHLQTMAAFVAVHRHLIRLEMIPGLQYVTVAMSLAVLGDTKAFACEIDMLPGSAEPEIPICPESASESERSVLLQAEELMRVVKAPIPGNIDDALAAGDIFSSDDTTALPMPLDIQLVQQKAVVVPAAASSDLHESLSDQEDVSSKRTRSHTPSEDECSGQAKELGGADYWTQLPPETTGSSRSQRRKRRKRARRRAMKDRLDTLLDTLEAEIQNPLQGRGLGQLLQVQTRIAAIQQKLCNAALLLADPMTTTSTEASTRHE
ncbi:hypothetical protein H4S08_001441 [Coemansia sp. RSA 1365]|nr:hypothetical protein H4S08_001441 [Coemansia sp. RSA 1365]